MFGAGAPASSLPPSLDLSSLMPPILDQGRVGDCTAHTALECREFLTLKAGDPLERFARLYEYARTRQREGTPLSSDSGASVSDAFATVEDLGACPVSVWSDDQAFSADPGPECDAAAKPHAVTLGFAIPGLDDLKASLAQGFPVGFGFEVPEQMVSDECSASGIVTIPASLTDSSLWTGEGHAVTACGYDDTMIISGTAGAVLCQNHWGASWGQKGRFWLPYWFWQNGVAADCQTFRRAE